MSISQLRRRALILVMLTFLITRGRTQDTIATPLAFYETAPPVGDKPPTAKSRVARVQVPFSFEIKEANGPAVAELAKLEATTPLSDASGASVAPGKN